MATIADARAALDRLEPAVRAALQRIALETAGRVRAGYVQRLDAQLHPGHSGRTAASARVLEEAAQHQYVVNVPGHPDKPANLPLWLEYGTRSMVARPALRAAAAAESDRYVAEMGRAAEGAVARALKELL
jgi:hypothetical protein